MVIQRGFNLGKELDYNGTALPVVRY